MIGDTRGRLVLRWMLAFFFTAGGIAHLYAPDKLLVITPLWVPFSRQLILVTGALEIVGSLALLTRPARKAAGVAFAIYAVCVWPANIKQAIEGIILPPLPDSWWYHGPRLAFQPVIIWASLYASGAIGWPWKRRSDLVGSTA